MMNEIQLKIHDEADLYNPLDSDQVLLSDDVVSYVIRKYQELDHREEFCLRIISDVPVNEDRVRDNRRSYMKHQQDIESDEHHMNTIRQIRLFVIGIAFIAVWLMVSANTESIGVEVLSIIGSVALWGATDIWISEKPRIRLKKLRLKILENTGGRFTVTGTEN